MKFKYINYNLKNQILKIELLEIEKKVILKEAVWNELYEAFKIADKDNEVRVIIISSESQKFFASGSDIKELNERPYMKALEGYAQETLNYLENIGKPSIAIIDGYCLGGGNELAMACDLRIATKKSIFGQPELSLGIIPGAGGIKRLVRLVGYGKTKELILTGRKVNADEACKIGLINYLEETKEAANEKAEELAELLLNQGQNALMLAKIVINETNDMEGQIDIIEKLSQTIAFANEERKILTQNFIDKTNK